MKDNTTKRIFKTLIQKKFESIDLSATNATFITMSQKGELKVIFFTTPTGNTKLNHIEPPSV